MPPKPQIYKFVSFKIIGFESNLFRRDFCWFASLVIVVNWVEPTKDFGFSILADIHHGLLHSKLSGIGSTLPHSTSLNV